MMDAGRKQTYSEIIYKTYTIYFKMKNVLITGGAGFIGSHVALKLIEKGYSVTILDNLSLQIHGEDPVKTSPLYCSIKDKATFIKGDVSNHTDWEHAIKGQDAIIHLAAETGTGQSMYEVYKYVNTNIGGTAIMLDILANCKHSVQKVVVAESRAIYGEGKYWSDELNSYVYPDGRSDDTMKLGDFDVRYSNCKQKLKLVPTTEDSKIHPDSVYGVTKQVQGQLVHLVCKSIGVESVSLRYQNVYGPGQSLSNPYTGILSIFSTRIKNGNEINIFEDGMESRDFVYIEDVVDATVLALETTGISGLAFNIGTGVPTTVMTVAKTLVKYYGISVPIRVSGNYRLGDIRHNYADIALAKEKLGFFPKWTFERGVERFVEWVNLQNVQKDRYEDSIREMKERGLYK